MGPVKKTIQAKFLSQGAGPAPFEEDAARILNQLRCTFSEVIDAVPSDIRKGADLMRALRIDNKLSWSIFKVANTPNPIAAGLHVPSLSSLETFFKAAAKSGVPSALVKKASKTAEEFQNIVDTHAGDRAVFDSMVSALAAEETMDQMDLKHRRAAFRAQRHLYGVHIRTQFKLTILHPSGEGDLLDLASVEGGIAIRRLRDTAHVYVTYSMLTNDRGAIQSVNRVPIDPSANADESNLLREFCSDPLPQFRYVSCGKDAYCGELVNNGLGNRAAVTCVTGLMARQAVTRYKDEDNYKGCILVTAFTPCEVLNMDLMVHEDLFDSLNPYVQIADDRFGKLFPPPANIDLFMAFNQSVQYLGKGASGLHSQDIPNYARLGQYVFDKLGWESNRYGIYRCRIEYPVIPASYALLFDLPEHPNGNSK